MSSIKLKTGSQKKTVNKVAINGKSNNGCGDKIKEIELTIKADRTKSLLNNVCSKLESLNYDNFDTLFPELLSNMKEAAILRNELINEVGAEKLMEKRPELFSTAKQIEIKYDSTVKKFFEEERRLERELNTLNQMKKLTAYQR